MSFPRGKPSARDTQEQYARQARRYAESSVHRGDESLEAVRRLAAPAENDVALDIGTGAGFTAFALADAAGQVIAMDLTPEMLSQARRLAQERRPRPSVDWVAAAAESLPFPDSSLSLVTSRYASHHFHNLPQALTEAARVLTPEGRLVMCDVATPEPPHLEQLTNELEQVRDPTHVWDYPISRWRTELLPQAGFRVREVMPGRTRQSFSEWVHRAGTPPDAIHQLLEMFRTMSAEAQEALQMRWEGADVFFSWVTVTILAEKA